MTTKKRIGGLALRLALTLCCAALGPARAAAQLTLPTAEQVERRLARGHGRPSGLRGVFGVHPYDFGGVLPRHLVFKACSDRNPLEHTILPSGGWCGSFATDGEDVWRLGETKRRSAEDLLRRSGAQLEQLDARSLAQLFATLLFDERNFFHTVVASSDDILKKKPLYVPDEAERPKYEGKILPPSVKAKAGGGWTVEFYTLSGWMHRTRAVKHHRVEVSTRYDLKPQSSVLSERVYSKGFEVMY